MAERISITTPVGRIVAGNLYRANDKDFDGNPLKYKTGPNAGQPRIEFFFALAIPKNGETHWGHTAWGRQIWDAGCAAFPQASQRPDFAWKITDGDSTALNKRNKKPCDNEGYPGHWVLNLRGGYAPKIYRIENGGYVQVVEPDAVKPGYYVEVNFNVEGNGNQNNPGVYLNHSMVCFRAYGTEIVFGPDVTQAGFGQGTLPAGASTAPPASTVPLPAPTAPATHLPPAAQGITPPPTSSAVYAPAGTPSPIPVMPNPQFLQVPPPGAATNPAAASSAGLPSVPMTGTTALPPAPPVTPSPSSPRFQMTALAGQYTREQMLAANWTDAQLIQAGYMVQV